MTAAADQTFRDVVREAIGRRDAIMRWVSDAGGVEGVAANLSKLAWRRFARQHRGHRGRVFFGRDHRAVGMAGNCQSSCGRTQDRSRAIGALCALGFIVRIGPHRDLSRYLLHHEFGGATRRASIVTSAIDDTAWSSALTPNKRAVYCAAATPPRRSQPRPQRRACHRRA